MRFALLLLLAAPAGAQAATLHLVAGPAGSLLRTGPVNAKLGTPVRMCAVLKVGRRHYADVDRRIRLGRRRLRPTPTHLLGQNLRWRWFMVEPRPHHVETPPPNEGNPAYSNSVLFGSRHGKWLGYDKIEYQERSVPDASGSCITVRRATPSHPKVNVHRGLGTMRYRVSVTLALGGRSLSLSTPGMAARVRGGISPRVQRVTFRGGDGLVGYLRGFFNVPNVFGSAGSGRTHQTELYQGADCADVIIGAARAAGAPIRYTSARGLRRYARPVTGKLLMTADAITYAEGPRVGQHAVLRFGRDVSPGDIMLIDYVGFQGSPRSWDHVAVIDRDRGVRGQFDPADPVLHMGYLYGLTEEAASSQAPTVIQILRLKRSVRRKLGRSRVRPSS